MQPFDLVVEEAVVEDVIYTTQVPSQIPFTHRPSQIEASLGQDEQNSLLDIDTEVVEEDPGVVEEAVVDIGGKSMQVPLHTPF